jgi:hypothetical protein
MYFQALIVYHGRPPFNTGALSLSRLQSMLKSRLCEENGADKIIALTITPAERPSVSRKRKASKEAETLEA